MKKAKIFMVAIALFASQICGCTFLRKTDRTADQSSETGNGLFSWSESVLEKENAAQLFATMQNCGFTELYQFFPDDISDACLNQFFEEASKYSISIYYLTGSPEWALEPDGKAMCGEVDRAVALNERLKDNRRLTGIFMDTEPYLLDEWETKEPEIMDSYIKAMEYTHTKATGEGLSYIACVPFYYDNMGHEAELKKLLETGCDTLAVMNYSKRDEAGQIETEMELAKEAGKQVIVIYEIQEPGVYGLTETNTYYNDGLGAVMESVSGLKEIYGQDAFLYALHEYNSLREMIECE